MTDFKIKGKTVIGLTGSIASGKSAAAEIFKRLGAFVISADELSAKFFDVLTPQIKDYFNTSDKGEIAKQVFADAEKRKWLEAKLHPLILAEALQLIQNSQSKTVIFDVPLLFETGLKSSFDLTICICADYDIRLNRAVLRGLKAEDFKHRDLSQMPQEEKIKSADIVFKNNLTPIDLEVQIKKFYYGLTK